MALDAGIFNALMQPRKSALDYANEFEDRANQREALGMQRQMNALQLDQAKQAQADDASLRNYLSGGADLSTPEGQAGLYRAAPKAAGGILKDRFAMAKDQAAVKETEAKTATSKYDLQRKKLEHGIASLAASPDPDTAKQRIIQGVNDGVLDMQSASKSIAELEAMQGNPQAYQQWRSSRLMGILSAKDQLEHGIKQQEFQLKANNELIGPDGQVNQPLLGAKKQVAQAGASSVSVNTGQKGLDNEFKLRGEFKSEPVYKAHQEMQSAYAQIQQSLKQASPAGDLAGATKIMKLLDPGSVVRESELGMAMAATGLLDRAQNYATNIINGTKLTPKQRQDFQRLADALYSESVKAYNAKRGEYDQLGSEYGLNAPRAIGPAAANPKAPPAASGMPDSSAIDAELARRAKGGK